MSETSKSALEDRLERLRLHTSKALDDRVKETIAAGSKHAGVSQLPRKGIVVRLHRMKTAVWKLGLAAAGIALALTVWALLSARSSIFPAAYAQVEEALANSKAAEWVHMKGTISGQQIEGWASLNPYRSSAKLADGKLQMVDLGKRLRYDYSPGMHAIFIAQVTDTLPAELNGKQSFFDLIEATLKKYQAQGSMHLVREQRVIDGRACTVLKISDSMKGGQGSSEFAIDPAEKRLVQLEIFDAGKSLGKLYYDYPATGPEDIYALGAPRDAKVVNASPTPSAAPLDPAVEKLQKAVIDARDRFAPTYCATIFEGSVLHNGSLQPMNLDVVYKKNGQWRWERYVTADARGYVLPPDFFRPGDLRSLMDWVGNHRPWQVAIMTSLEEDYEHRNCGVHFSLGKDGRLEKALAGNAVQNTPEYFSWHDVAMSGGKHALLPSRQGDFGQLGILERTDQAYIDGKGFIGVPQRGQWSVNPSRDFIVEEYVFDSNPENAPWQVDKDWRKGLELTPQQENRWSESRRVLEYGQTERGQWYAKKILRNQNEMFIVNVTTAREIANELFDPSKINPAQLDDRFTDHPSR